MKLLKIIFFNFSIFFFFLLIIEIIFGDWIKKDNFGYSVREIRNVNIPISVEYDNVKYNYTFIRNNLGFIGNDIDPKKIKILFLGGSTGEEMFVPPKFRIVDQLNTKLSEDNINLKIINASKGGKSTKGYVNDFIFWFSKIKNLNPKIVVFYTGINDSYLELPNYFNETQKRSKLDRYEDLLKNNSIFYKLKKKVQNKYFNKLRKYYNLVENNLYDNFNFNSYLEAKKIYNNINLNDKDKIVLNNFEKNLKNLNNIIVDKKLTPIFITQVGFNGISDKRLYLVNEYLKYFCKKNNYKIIKIDEKIDNLSKGDFYDNVHTTIKGSTKISNFIYSDLKEIFIKEFNLF